MKKLVLFAILFFACSSRHDKTDRKIFVQEFKVKYFKKCLQYEMGNSPEIKTILDQDKSGYSEPILGKFYVFVDSIAKQRSMARKTSRENVKTQKAEGSEGNKAFETCLCEYESKWLDSLVKKKFSGR